MRLHDPSSSTCPACLDTYADINHVIGCSALGHAASVAACQYVYPGGMPDVRSSREVRLRTLVSINDTPFARPVNFNCHVLHSLGVFASNFNELKYRLTVLSVLQHSFISLRKLGIVCEAVDMSSDRVKSAANAAIWSLR